MFVQSIGTVLLAMLLLPAAGDAPLADAAMRGDRAGVQSLLAQKADVNAAQGDGTTALHWATYRDDLEMARMLIQAGADLKAKTRLGEMTSLFMAAKNGNRAMLELLLEAGDDANATSTTGTTPFMLAAASGKADAVTVLLDHEAAVNATDITSGQTALMFAAARNRAEVVKVLAEHGADLNATSRVNRIPTPENPDRNRDIEKHKSYDHGRFDRVALCGSGRPDGRCASVGGGGSQRQPGQCVGQGERHDAGHHQRQLRHREISA